MRFGSTSAVSIVGGILALAGRTLADTEKNATWAPPKNVGILLFPAFDMLDVAGPQEALTWTSFTHTLNLYFIGPTLDPVSNKVTSMNSSNSSFGASIVPTHTYDNPPPLDLLIIPGGGGTRAPGLEPAVEFVREQFDSLKYLLTICTGAGIAARAGVLDGRNATTNKAAWKQTIALGPKVNWISHARWVEDGKVWTTSGVSAGIDGTLAFVEKIWGAELSNKTSVMMEWDRHSNSSWDPFALYWKLDE